MSIAVRCGNGAERCAPDRRRRHRRSLIVGPAGRVVIGRLRPAFPRLRLRGKPLRPSGRGGVGAARSVGDDYLKVEHVAKIASDGGTLHELRGFAIDATFFQANMLGTILLIILILLLIGALPTWGYSTGWGYYPSGGVGLLLVIVIVLLLIGRL
jgi:hypothetical protein